MEISSEGKQATFLNSAWQPVVAAALKVDHQQIKKPTDLMEGRLITVFEKEGGHIGR